jgi:hypothetical protein
MPNACADLKSEERNEFKWTGICPNDYTHVLRRNQLTKSTRHSACTRCCRKYNGGRFDERFIFEWHLTEDLKASGKPGVKITNQPEQQSQMPIRISEAMAAMKITGE